MIDVIDQMDQAVWTHTKYLNELVPEGKHDLLIAEWTLSGYSKSALRTGFKMGPFYLDAGHSVFGKWNVVLISHGHADHIFSFASFFLVGSSILDGTQTVIAPNTTLVRQIADTTIQCNYNTDKFHVSAKFIDAVPDDSHEITIGKEKYLVDVLEMDHSVPTVGYCVKKASSRLNPVLLPLKDKLNSKEFGYLMRAIRTLTPVPSNLEDVIRDTVLPDADQISIEHWIPQFCFLTDTSIKGISDHIDLIGDYPIIIVECTFYDRDDLDYAAKKKHIHWNHIQPYIQLYPDSLWILIHSSQRYKGITEILDSICNNPEPTNVVPSNCLIWI